MRIAVFAIALCCAGTAFAQPTPVRLNGRPSCASCRIVIADTFSIGAPNDPILLDFSSRIAITSTSVFATGMGSAPIAIYDRSGRFIAPFGRLGAGPGEIRHANPVLVSTPGDSLYVSSQPNMHLYSPGRAMVRSFAMSYFYHFVVLGTGRIVVTGSMRDTARTVYPAHLVSANGVRERSFGSLEKYNPACSWCALFAIGAGANGTVWTSTPQKYELTHWDISGRLLDHVLIQNSPWFVEWDAELQSNAPGPVTRVRDISYDNAGILWIQAAVPLVNRGRSSGGGGGLMVGGGDFNPFEEYASIIEAYDTNRHELLASLRLDKQDVRLLPGGMAASLRHDSSGFVRYMIGRLTIRR